MSNTIDECTLILSIAPSVQGFGFAFFDGIWTPIDWGFKKTSKPKNEQTCLQVEALIERYSPDVLLIEDPLPEKPAVRWTRAPRVKTLLSDLEALGEKKNILVAKYTRGDIQECFAQFNAKSKYEIASAISQHLPEFTAQLPPRKKLWLPESNYITVFDAVSLIFTHFYFLAIKPNTKEGK